ncbi:DUF2934 domain-containing protein [Rhizobium sp. BK251]|uniref:DUF2934 domain-containing protein n=1 Tax=Rhizobium sp. BK251 TaxID=2512125 RepID=UPI00104FA761|nr:DUF2934 domain-containing protein [Rhizobium sp. BK251]
MAKCRTLPPGTCWLRQTYPQSTQGDEDGRSRAKQRERAYKIWEDEGNPDGRHLDHWQYAEEQHEATEQDAAAVAKANQKDSERAAGTDGRSRTVGDMQPPSTPTGD